MPKIHGVYSGLKYFGFDVDGDNFPDNVDNTIDTYVSCNKEDAIVSVFTLPSEFAHLSESITPHSEHVDIPDSIGNYTPRNKKLLTYPYSFLTVDCLNDSHDYRYEWFRETDSNLSDESIMSPRVARFIQVCAISPNPEIVLEPLGYNCGDGGVNYSESLTLTGFPQLPFMIDSYRAWLAQSAGKDIASILGSLAVGLVGTMSANPLIAAGGVASLGNAVGNTISTVQTATKGSKTRGSSGANTLVGRRAMGFYYKQMGITEYMARILDDYFDMYGYACCEVKLPQISVRPRWTYVKTKGFTLNGCVPADDAKKIAEIYDNGITFWRHTTEVGNYHLSNRTDDMG